jgi:glyoxylase-like metal-dependent hydrolase (beta-lactamase superfamily II)
MSDPSSMTPVARSSHDSGVIRPKRGAAFLVADNVVCVPQTMVNCFLVGSQGAKDRQWTLIDAAMPWSKRAIMSAAADRFGPHSRPRAIALTHGHFDHVGCAAELAAEWDAPVFAHQLELPYLTGRSSYPPPDATVGGGAMSAMSRFLPKGPINLGNRVRVLPENRSVTGMPEWRWVTTPGHAPGHVSFFRDADRTLIVGDAFVTQRQEAMWGVLTRSPKIRRPPAYFTPDWTLAQESVERLANLEPEIAATGHGWPMRGEVLRSGLAALLRDWDEVSVPRYGRYVQSPAITDAEGVVALPPPVVDRQMIAAAGVTAFALGALVIASRVNYRRTT